MKRKWFFLLAVLALLALTIPAAVGASPAQGEKDSVAQVDFRMDPLTQAQLDAKMVALDAQLNGKAYGKTHEVARGQYVELAREGEDPVWTVLG
jgi:immune inhibitor A